MEITLRHLEQIETLARCRSFARAAAQLHLSQPALSRSISTLEDRLGVRLFDRTPGMVTPTLFGRHLLEKGGPVLQEMRVMQRDLNLLRGVQAGEIRIGCGPFPAETFVGEALAAFHKDHPGLSIKVTVDKTPRLVELLRNRHLDLFVADTRSLNGDGDLDIVDLTQQQGFFCCRPSHPLMSQKTLAVREILEFPVAMMWLPDLIISLLNEVSGLRLSTLADLPSAVIECDNLTVLFRIISMTDAVGITSERAIKRSCSPRDIALLPLFLPDFRTEYGIVSGARLSSPPALELLKKHIVSAAAA